MIAIPLVCAYFTVAQAQIRTDGSLNRPAASLSGPNFLITEAQGRLAGSNLFYSFQVFNVGNAESATFVTTTAGLANVISRVTGGSPSQINGLVSLQSTNAAPNFFFINPAGVVFGQGAQIDVPAGFHVSTANYLKFPDGNFYVDPKAVSTLSSAAPEALGFLGTTRAAITIEDRAILQTTSSKDDQPISLVAGDIEINNAVVQTNGSDIRVVAVGSGVQEVGLTGALPDVSGNLDIRTGGYLFSNPSGSNKGGDILVAAGNVMIYGEGDFGPYTGVASQTLKPATGNAGDIMINVVGTLTVANDGSIGADTTSSGHGGGIRVTAGNIVLNSSSITSLADPGSSGYAGNIDVATSGALSMLDGGQISSSTFSSGNAGTVTVQAGNISIEGVASPKSTAIFSRAEIGSTGDAGSVDVTTSGVLSIFSGGEISTSTFGSGRAGSVSVSAGTISGDSNGSIGATATTLSSRTDRNRSRAGQRGDHTLQRRRLVAAVCRAGPVTCCGSTPSSRCPQYLPRMH